MSWDCDVRSKLQLKDSAGRVAMTEAYGGRRIQWQRPKVVVVQK